MSTFFQLSVLLTALLAVAVNAGLHCSKAQGPRYGYISSGKKDSYRAGSVVIFKCNRRYKLSGQAMTKCVAKGNSAYWNSRVPICRKQTTVTGNLYIQCTLYSRTSLLWTPLRSNSRSNCPD